jgi:hypothetical protein
MRGYQRPPLPELVFRDESGAVIPYGRRWVARDGDGPEETYSVTAHPERFEPFVEVAQAIVEHLMATYDICRADVTEAAGIRRVRLVPRDTAAAPLEFVFRSATRVDVTAGVTTSIAWFCDCDHCDEDLQVVVGSLEQEISAVVEGGLREWLNEGYDLYTARELRSADGELERGGSSYVSSRDRDEVHMRFADVPPQWAPWRLRRHLR